MVYMHKKVYKNLLTSAEWLNLDRVRIKEGNKLGFKCIFPFLISKNSKQKLQILIQCQVVQMHFCCYSLTFSISLRTFIMKIISRK